MIGSARRLGAWLATACAVLVLLLIATAATAHEVRPALLQIYEDAPGRYEVTWKQPVVGDMAVHLVPHLSSGVLDKAPTTQDAAPGFRIKTWAVQGPPLDGQTITIEGLPQSVTDVLLRVHLSNGKDVSAVMRPSEPTYVLDLAGPKGIAVPGYLRMGVEHILTGFDHLLFVFGLFLLIGANWRLFKAITAFTAAHTITLGLAALGYIHFPSAIIEALVALSIVFVACELLADPKGAGRLAHRWPWVIALTFGLLHGLAFAGALADVGLPRGAAPQALLMFNLGVEIGQVAFIGTAIGVVKLLERLPRRPDLVARPVARAAPAYLIGALSAYWLIDRILTAAAPPV